MFTPENCELVDFQRVVRCGSFAKDFELPVPLAGLLEKDHERPPALGTFRADPNSSALADTIHGGSREAKDNFPSDVP